jgi:hypothetical protein
MKKVYFNFSTKLSLFLFNNTLGLKVNLLWLFYTYKVKFKSKNIHKSCEISDNLKKNGFAYIANCNVDILSEKVEQVFALQKYKDIENIKFSYEIEKIDLEGIAMPLFEILNNNTSAITNYYKSNFQIYWSSIQRTIPGKMTTATSFGWHLDDNPKQLLKLFIYLNDVMEFNGAFRTFNYYDTDLINKKGFKSNTEINRVNSQSIVNNLLIEKKIHLNVLEGIKGTMLCFDNNLIHKGTLPIQGFRNLIQIEIYPSDSELTYENVFNSLTNKIVTDYPKNPFYNDMNNSPL